MTKAKALKQLMEYSRNVIEPTFASKLAQAFGYSLKELDIKPRFLSEFRRLNFDPATAKLKAVSVQELMQALVWKIKGQKITSACLGEGSRADHIVEQAVKLLK